MTIKKFMESENKYRSICAVQRHCHDKCRIWIRTVMSMACVHMRCTSVF